MHKLVTLIGFILATYLIYWASFPWTFVGSFLMISGYFAFLLVRRTNLELKRNIWVLVYLIGIMAVSILGDPKFVFNNFTPWNPLGLLRMPYDLIFLTIFAGIIYFWVYHLNTKDLEKMQESIEKKKV
jgi:hypothetical protein